MQTVAFNPAMPVAVRAAVSSPQSSSLRLQYQLPSQPWVDFANAHDAKPAGGTEHQYHLDALRPNTSLRFEFAFVGTPDTPYAVIVGLAQHGASLAPLIQAVGTTDASGSAIERIDVVLQ